MVVSAEAVASRPLLANIGKHATVSGPISSGVHRSKFAGRRVDWRFRPVMIRGGAVSWRGRAPQEVSRSSFAGPFEAALSRGAETDIEHHRKPPCADSRVAGSRLKSQLDSGRGCLGAQRQHHTKSPMCVSAPSHLQPQTIASDVPLFARPPQVGRARRKTTPSPEAALRGRGAACCTAVSEKLHTSRSHSNHCALAANY